MNLLNCSGINISFFSLTYQNFAIVLLQYLLRHLPRLACFFVSLFKILNMFCTLFYCYHHWLGKINSSSSAHPSKLILFSCYNNCNRVLSSFLSKNVCVRFFNGLKISHFSIWVFLIKQRFQKGKLKFTGETIELQKKLNWIKANKLILNSSLVFNLQRKKITGKNWILPKLQ